MENKDKIDGAIIYDRDYEYNYFGFKTLERSYLMKIDGKPVERPQHMLMRVSLGIHGNNLEKAMETYELGWLFLRWELAFGVIWGAENFVQKIT